MSVHRHLLLPQSHPNPIPHIYNKLPPTTHLPASLRASRRRASASTSSSGRRCSPRRTRPAASAGAGGELDLTEENVRSVLEEAKEELGQLFDTSVGITGVAELADLDGPFVKIRLKGRFWHERSMVLARLSNFLRKRIPEVLEVEIEDELQLDDSPANF